MNIIRAMIDGMNAGWQRERAQSQMTLGSLISALEAMPPDAVVANIGAPHSYRGYYCDLAFELSPGTRPAKDLLTDCRTTLNSTLCGYKSGLYRMTADVPVWVSDYGSCGERLMSIYPELQTAEEE